MKKLFAEASITAETSGSMVLVKRRGELISVKEINPNDVKKGFKRVCDSIDNYIKTTRNK